MGSVGGNRVVSARLRYVAGLLGSLFAFALLGGVAHAGQWVQVSCENPNGSSAPAQGWTAASGGSPEASSEANNSCSAGLPMGAFLSDDSAAPTGASEALTYTPPVGSTLAGGTMQVQLTADGYGSLSNPTSSGAALILSPTNTVNTEVETCAEWSDGCWAGQGQGSGLPADFSGGITLPSNAGGTITVLAACLNEPGGPACDQNGHDGVWAGVYVASADTLLSAGTAPVGSDFTGSILSPNATGTAALDFTASESQGPGIYNVTVAIDGRPVYSQTPNTDGGTCSAVGDWQGTSTLEFDAAQPCPLSDSLSVPITTSAFSDGQHALTVTITDAANNTTTAYSNTITINNPIASPLPAATRGVSRVRVRFTALAHYHGSKTRLLKLSESRLPRGGRVAVALSGSHRPRLRMTSAAGDRAKLLLRGLTRVTFSAGDKLVFTVTAPGRRSEQVQMRFRNAKVPSVKLL